MHEGLAKYLERRWRGPDAHRLAPSSEHLLKRRLDQDDLITFEQMHPSMAKLPSQEDAATAFAEVYTVMEYLEKVAGSGAFVELLDAINDGKSAKQAFAAVADTSFGAFEQQWKQYLRQRPTADYPENSDYDHTLVFKDEADSDSAKLGEPDKPKAKDHKKLAEMMQGRGHYDAAVVQYRKALDLAATPHPHMRAQMARCLTKVQKPDEALDVLEPIRELFPTYVTMWLELGRAHLAADQPRQAIDSLNEAARLNPFNPEIHTLLADAYNQTDQPDAADRARRHADLVR
jgi:Flp pilus assembly protein TadD